MRKYPKSKIWSGGDVTSPIARFSPRQIRWIREAWKTGDYTQIQMAQRFGSSQTCISLILSGKIYKGVK